MWVCRGLHMHYSARPAVVRIGASSPCLNTAEVQIQNGCITPRWIVGFGCIEVPIDSVSTRPRRNIDAGTASQNLTRVLGNGPAIQIWVRLSYEPPLQFNT